MKIFINNKTNNYPNFLMIFESNEKFESKKQKNQLKEGIISDLNSDLNSIYDSRINQSKTDEFRKNFIYPPNNDSKIFF